MTLGQLGDLSEHNRSWNVLEEVAASLPIIRDADFLCGPRTATGESTYAL